MELCSILRISINEFLAGEDIGTENVIEKSDSNLIQITKESKKKQKNLKTILAVVTVFAVIVSAILINKFLSNMSSSCTSEQSLRIVLLPNFYSHQF